MGIPSYFSYIMKNHPEIIQKYLKDYLNVNNLYLDCNSIVYDIYHKLEFDKLTDEISLDIIKKVCKKIEYYIELIKPNTRVIIAFDGVAPVAKLDQQRSRRYKSAYQNEVLREIHKKTDPDPWNTAAITPGTKFMKELSIYINKYFNNPKMYNVGNIINSTSEIFGEGEHKIFEYIRENANKHKDEITVIYGLDADLIMLSINHLPICPEIYLFRETPHFIKSINSSLEPNDNYILNISLLATDIITYMNNDVKLSCESKFNRVYDYIFLTFLLGNDFLPHFPSMNIRTGGINKLMDVYKATIGKTDQVLTDGTKIYWNNVRKLIQVLSNQEELYLKEEYKLRGKREKYNLPTESPEQIFKRFEAVPTYERDLEKYIDPFKDFWEFRYYQSLFNGNTTEENKKNICINYLEGLEWTLKYYTTGCPDWRWHYKYHYPPLLSDLIKYIPVFDTSFIDNKIANPVSQLVQLCYVLPQCSLNLLPENVYTKLMLEHSEWYKTDCEFIWCFCRYFWESHVQMNEINIQELETFIENNFQNIV